MPGRGGHWSIRPMDRGCIRAGWIARFRYSIHALGTCWQAAAEVHPRTIYAMALSKDGSTLISGARDDGGIRVWDVHELSLKREIDSPLGVYGIGFSSDEKEILSVHKEHQLSRWSFADGHLIERKHFPGESGLHSLTTAPQLSTAFAASGGGLIFRHRLDLPKSDATALCARQVFTRYLGRITPRD